MSNIIDSIQLSGTIYTLSAQTSGGGVPESTFSAYTAATDSRIAEDEEVTAAGLNALNDKIDSISGANAIEVTQAEYDALVTGGTVDPNAFYIITDAQAGDLTNYYTKTETNTLLGGKADTATTYTKTEVDNAITAATSTKQDTLVSSVNIKTINNESLLGSGNIDIQGGGKEIVAGRGIAITTGETADTVSFSLPISAGTGSNSIAEGFVTTANGNYGSHAEGFGTNANGDTSHAEGSLTNAIADHSHSEGYATIAKNLAEHASGRFNNSVSASTTFGDSGNTLFSVGNGTSDSARHNAFEIRQNGDIYLTKDGQDVKLQDQLGGGSITVDTALDSGSTNPVENRVIYNKIDEVEEVTAAALNNINDRLSEDEEVTAAALNNINDRLSEDEEVTAAGLNAVNDKFDGLKLKKLTQVEYNALATKDASTLYIIVN